MIVTTRPSQQVFVRMARHFHLSQWLKLWENQIWMKIFDFPFKLLCCLWNSLGNWAKGFNSKTHMSRKINVKQANLSFSYLRGIIHFVASILKVLSNKKEPQRYKCKFYNAILAVNRWCTLNEISSVADHLHMIIQCTNQCYRLVGLEYCLSMNTLFFHEIIKKCVWTETWLW